MNALTIATSGAFIGQVTDEPEAEQPALVKGKFVSPIFPHCGSRSRLMLQATSAAVNASPFQNLTPLRNVKFNTVLPAVSFHVVASSATILFVELNSNSWP